MFCISSVTAWTTILYWPMSVLPTPNDMDRGLDFRACRRPPSTRSTRWWRQAAPCSSSNDAIRKATRTAVADHVLFAAFALYNCTAHCLAASILVCRESTEISLLQNTRHSCWTSARELCLCIGVLGVSAADAQVMLGGLRPGAPHPVAGGHHPHCKRPRGPPPAHFPSDPAFVPRGLVVGAVAC